MSHTESIVGHVNHSAPSIIRAVTGENAGYSQTTFLSNGLDLVKQIQLVLGHTGQSSNEAGNMYILNLICHWIYPKISANFLKNIMRIQCTLWIVNIRIASISYFRIVHIGYNGAVVAKQATENHGSSFFFRCHLAQQIINTVLNGLTVVLVDIQRAVAVEVLEVQAVHLNELVLGRGAQLGLIAIGLNVVESGYAFLDDALFRHGGQSAQRSQHRNSQQPGNQFLHFHSTPFFLPLIRYRGLWSGVFLSPP